MKGLAADKRAFLRHTLYTAAAASGMVLLLYALLGVAPFGEGTVITGDLNAQYINYFAHFKRVVFGDAGFFYGFDKSLGGPLIGLFAYYCTSPLNIAYLLAPVSTYPLVAGALLFFKIVLACVTFQVYMQSKFPALGWQSAVLGLCYGFCAYNIAYAQNIMWHDVVVLLPLVCLGLDHIAEGKSNRLYLVALSLAVFANFYIAFMVCLFAVLYFAAALWLRGPGKGGLKQPMLRFLGGSLFAGGINGALLLPTIANLNESKGELLAWRFSLEPNFSPLELPRKFLWGAFSGLEDQQAGLPLVYAGLLVLPLVLCFFISGKVRLKEKLAGGAFLMVLLFSFWLAGPNTLWHGLKAPVWFPYRYSFLLVFAMVGLAGAALAKGAAGKVELLVSGGVVAAVVLACLVLPGGFSAGKAAACIGALGAMVALLLLKKRFDGRLASRVLAGALAATVALELSLNAFYITRQLEPYPHSAYLSFLEQTGGTVDAIQAVDSDNYRMEKNFFRSMNDPMLLDYKGISHFGSTQDNAAADTLAALGYRGYPSYLYGSTAFADSVLGIRYLIADQSRPVPAHWQPSEVEAPMEVLQNPDAFPMFFTVTGGFSAGGHIDPADSFSYQNALYRCLGGGEEDLLLPAYNVARMGAGGQPMATFETLLPGEYYRVTAQEAGHYYALVNAANGILYDLPILLNGEEKGRYFSADHTGIIDLGALAAGDAATLAFGQEEPIGINSLWFTYTPEGRLETLAQTARDNSGSFIMRDGAVEGRITAAAGRETLFTSVPFNQGWRAAVNGRAVTPRDYGGFLSVPLEAGENTVSLRYEQAGALPGLAVSGGSLAMLLGYLLWRRKSKSKAGG